MSGGGTPKGKNRTPAVATPLRGVTAAVIRCLRTGLLCLAVSGLAGLPALTTPALAGDEVVIGDVFPYSLVPAHAQSYRNGALLALDAVNSDKRTIRWVTLDSKGDPGAVSRLVSRLLLREKAAMITGTFFSHVALAVAEQAKRQKFVFLAAEPLADSLTLHNGNRYTFRLRPSTSMQVKMLLQYADPASGNRATPPEVTTIAPDYAYGHDAVAAFKAALPSANVTEQWPGLNQIDAAAEVKALLRSQPDTVFNVTFGGDLAKLVRELKTAAADTTFRVYSLLTGEPEYLLPLGTEAPVGWIVTGYPVALYDDPRHARFVDAYKQRYGELPMLGGLVGYMTILSAAAAVDRAGSTETEALRQAFLDLPVSTPLGDIVFRALDHQSTMGTWVGSLSREQGVVGMYDARYFPGAAFMPEPDHVRAVRPDIDPEAHNN